MFRIHQSIFGGVLSAIVAVTFGFMGNANAEPANQLFDPFVINSGSSISYGNLTLAMQTDGNLVLYRDGNYPLWNTATQRSCGVGGCQAVFQGDGNLVLYQGSNYFAYTGTFGQGLKLKLSSAPPYISIVSGQSTIWSGTSSFQYLYLNSGTSMSLPSHLTLAMQTDGNLVLYDGSGQPIWYTGTNRPCGVGGCAAIMQDDGNLVLYQGNTPYWYTATQGNGLTLNVSINNESYVSIFSGGTRVWPTAPSAAPASTSSQSSGQLNCWGKPIDIYGPC